MCLQILDVANFFSHTFNRWWMLSVLWFVKWKYMFKNPFWTSNLHKSCKTNTQEFQYITYSDSLTLTFYSMYLPLSFSPPPHTDAHTFCFLKNHSQINCKHISLLLVISVRFLRTETTYNQSTSMESGNLTLIQYYLIHYASSNFVNCELSIDSEFHSYFLPPIQDSICHISSYLPACCLPACLPSFLSLRSLYFSYPYYLLFFSVHCSKVCVCVMFFHDYDFFFKADIVFSGHHIRRHMLSIYNITDSDNIGYLIKLSRPMTIFSFVTSYFYINTVSMGK